MEQNNKHFKKFNNCNRIRKKNNLNNKQSAIKFKKPVNKFKKMIPN